MKLGILSDDLERKALKIIAEHPDVLAAFLYDSLLTIESDNINKVVEDLEEEHGLHLIINGDGDYMIASVLDENLASIVANAGKSVANAASSAVNTATSAAGSVAKKIGNFFGDDEEDVEEVEEVIETQEEEEDEKKNPDQRAKEAEQEYKEKSKEMDKKEKEIAAKEKLSELAGLGVDISEIILPENFVRIQ